MKKLSTKIIRDMMSDWLCTPELRKLISERTIDCDESEREQHWKNWCDVKQWKRYEKFKLADFTADYFNGPNFPIDTAGWANETLFTKYFNDHKLAAQCIFRMFVPNNDFEDSYRLEVITSHDDTEIVGWIIVED